MKELEQFRKERRLVSIRRDAVDDNAIQCFILATSTELVLLQYVYDTPLMLVPQPS